MNTTTILANETATQITIIELQAALEVATLHLRNALYGVPKQKAAAADWLLQQQQAGDDLANYLNERQAA